MEVSSSRRSTRQIRKSLHETRKRLDRDLSELEDRAEDRLSPKNVLTRHPVLITAAGVVVGLLVVRNPAMIGRVLTRVAQASAPFLVRALLQRGGNAVGEMSTETAASSEST